jgi:CubicO group peptidase (beta-lactamase class C family)
VQPAFPIVRRIADRRRRRSCLHLARFLSFAFALAFGTAFGAVADSPAPQAPLALSVADIASVVDPRIAEWIGKRKGPGAVVVVVNRDSQIFAKGYGFSDIDARAPFTANATLVRPGSISKLFTGIAVMQLVDTGRLDLDGDVNGYIDFAIPVSAGDVPVTLRRLLMHRAGFEEHLKGLFSRKRQPDPLGGWLAKNLPRRLFPKGDVEAYSNYGIALAGYIVERVSGEPFAAYVQRHILNPLGMSHSTFQQPLPDDLAPFMAKGYRQSDRPPLAFFETLIAPAGGLSATGTDMGRFMRALMNGGELDGVRILPKVRLDDMMAPSASTPAGYIGLVFVGTKAAGHDSIGHNGATMTFFSDLQIFAEQGLGIFVSRDGIGEINSAKEARELPNPAVEIAKHFLDKVPIAADARAATLTGGSGVAGIYHSSRRAESSWMRLIDLLSQLVVKIDGAGNIRLFSALWPFGDGEAFARVENHVYEGPARVRIAFIDDVGSEPYIIIHPTIRLQRVPWFLDVRWIAPAFAASTAVTLLTLLVWPIAALGRHWRKRPWGQDRGDRQQYSATRLVLLVDAIVIVAAAVFCLMSLRDPSIFNDELDPLVLVFYALAWLGVFGAIVTVWTATRFCRNGVGSRWSRIHHSLIAASSVVIAWLFLTLRIAGTTLTY